MKWLVVISCFVFFSCRQKEETTRAVVQNITESVYASGKIKSKDQYEVYSSVNGIVKQVYVTDGSLVKKGDVLLSLVNEAPELQRENAQLATYYQSLQTNRDKLAEAEATIDLAQTKWQNDSLLLHRQKMLWANDIGSRYELEQRELAVKNSKTALQTAHLRYRQLKKQLVFADEQARKTLQISSTVVNDYSVRAKQDGKVYLLSKEPGEVVSPQAPLAIIGNAQDFLLELQVDEYDVAKIRLGQTVLITMDSYKGQVFEAVVSKIDPIMNERSRSVTIEAKFTKQPPNLLPNLSAEANVVIRTKQNALTIPRNYLVDETSVILQNGEKRAVTVGLKDYQFAEITGGITADDVLKKPAE
jgi:multidrug efflux pump subunit AcrA (membrane-fusion protein)